MRNKVLIVDDVELNRDLLADMLYDGFGIITAENGERALEILEQRSEEIAVVLLDLVMPGMDGYEVLKAYNKMPSKNRMIVIVISSDDDEEAELKCMKLGAVDFIRRPFNATIVRKKLFSSLNLINYQKTLEEKIREQTKDLKEQYELLKVQAIKLQQSKIELIDIFSTVVEYRDLESGEHIKRVKEYTRLMAEGIMEDYPEYGLTEFKKEIIVAASALHDIGKIAIPDSVLLKPGRLTDEEYQIMKTHTEKGSEILKNIKNAWDEEYSKASYDICRYHHERYDGKGYPDGLKGDEIPISAQIVSIADVYDALVNERVYKDKFTKEKAFEMIVNGECGVFSPKIIDVFTKVRKQFERITDASDN